MSDEPEAPIATSPPSPALTPAVLKRKKWNLFVIVAMLSLVADQGTKIWARTSLPVAAIVGHGHKGECVIPEDIASHACQGTDWV